MVVSLITPIIAKNSGSSFAKEQRVFDPVIIEGKEVELVTSTKLLGLTIANDLTWNDHVTEITKKASKRLYFLTQLKRAGVPKQDLALFYVSCVRSVIDYAALCKLIKNEFVFNFSDYCQEISFCKFVQQLLWAFNEIKRNIYNYLHKCFGYDNASIVAV